MKKFILEPELSFYNYHEQKVQCEVWDELEQGLWQKFDIDAYLKNNLLGPVQLAESQAVFDGYHQIVPGTYWNIDKQRLELDLYSPKYVQDCSFSSFIEASARYFDGLNAKRIGVHLSGGLDSSLIMSLLKVLDLPFVPIGLKSDTFEFRTEKKIQEILLEWGEDGLLIDIEDCPFYSDMISIPAHQIPDGDIKSVASAKALAKAFIERGCDVVLSGQGGDSLLVDEVKDIQDLTFNIGNEFINYTEQDRIYGPAGLRLESFFADTEIIDILCSARIGQKDDPLKLWMRRWAKDILPRELSEYAYFADFFGLTSWGLHEATPVIKELMGEAYEISHFSHFSPKNVKKFLEQDVFSFEHRDYIEYCGLISVASWYHSLFNNE